MKISKYFRLMFNAPDDNGGGGDDLPGATEVLNGNGASGGTPSADPAAQKASATPSWDPNALAESFAGALQKAGFNPQQQTPAAPQPTQEEIDKALKKWKFSPEWFQQVGNPETQQSAWEQYHNGTVEHLDTIMQARLMQMQQQIMQQFSPVMQYYQQQQAEHHWTAFGTKHKELSNPALRPLLTAVMNDMNGGGFKASSPEHYYDELAKRAERVIQATNPQFKLGAQASTNNGQSRGSGSIPVTTPGGNSAGGGGSGKPSGDKFKATEFLGPVGPRR